ncbi:MAG: cell surface protein SprA, partial [Flavobacteriaceae bacterium]|nr:cell surface protein SprA [Flavobacteriaceae bacterium]
MTQPGTSDPETIWPSVNDLNSDLKAFGPLKIDRNKNGSPSEIYPSVAADPNAQLRVKGNPNLSNIRTIMIGVKNRAVTQRSAELWFNELRLTDFDNKGGWAAVLNADANFADFADVSLSGRANSQGFGSIEQRANERSMEDVKLYDIVTNVNLGQLLPKKTGIKIPFNYSISEEFRDPKWDPKYQDVLLKDALNEGADSEKSRDYTKRTSINFINVHKERTNPEKKQHFYDVENVSVSYSYSENYHRDYNVQKYVDQNVRAAANYNYSFKPKSIEPLKNWKLLANSNFFKFIKDFNFNYLPSSLSVNSNINRHFNQQQSRDLVGLGDLPELTQRRYMFDWDYNIAYNLTRSLQFTFRASNNYIYDSFETNSDGDVINGEIFNNFFTIGRPYHYHQTLNGTYNIPINKIPWF